MAIRYDRKLNREIYSVVSRFNQKAKSLEGKTGVLIPDKISTKEIKSRVYDRRELRRELANLKKFLKPGAEEVVQIKAGFTSKYDIAVLKSNVRSAKARVNAKLQKLYNTELYILGKGTKQTYATMGVDRYLNLQTRREALEKDIYNLDKDEFERYINLVERSSESDKNREWKEHYLEIILKEGRDAGVDTKYIQNIHDKMMKLNPEQFIEVYNKELSVQNLAEMYRLYMEKTKKGLSTEGIIKNINSLYKNLSDKIDKILG